MPLRFGLSYVCPCSHWNVDLNVDRVPSPRGGTSSWAGAAIPEMLRRELYRDVLVWNETQSCRREPSA